MYEETERQQKGGKRGGMGGRSMQKAVVPANMAFIGALTTFVAIASLNSQDEIKIPAGYFADYSADNKYVLLAF